MYFASLEELLPNVMKLGDEFISNTWNTLLMLCIPGVISFLFGLLFGVILIATKKGGVMEQKSVYFVLDKIINLFRSIPFVILITLLDPLTRFLMGSAIDVKGALPALIIGTIPFFARQIESALAEVDDGVIEASQAMGIAPMQIITRVYLRESIPSIVRATTITLISLVGLIAIAGAVGAGGLGDMAIRYGYQRHQRDVTYVVVILILILVTAIQSIGTYIERKTTH